MPAQMPFRAVSFHHGFVSPDALDRSAALGFNAVELQVEGDTLNGLRTTRQRLDENDIIGRAHRLGMKVALWTHELSSYEPQEHGPPTVDNTAMWRLLEDRYRHVLTQQYADIDYLTLTVVETQHNLTKSGCLQKLVELLSRLCAESGKTLIFRSFVWHPDEQAEVVRTINALPKDVIIQTKYVPQDWHMRSIDHPLLGAFPGHTQFVELDVAGEYWRKSFLANCMADDLAVRCAHWRRQGVAGLVVRVDRRWREHQHSAFGQVQEANLWALGRWALGEDSRVGEVLHDFAAHHYGEAVADSVAQAIRTTGAVVAEAQCVLTETLGDTRTPVPCDRSMGQQPVVITDDDQQDAPGSNPFHRNWSRWRWDPAARSTYLKLRRGDQQVIAQKQSDYAHARQWALRSIDLVDGHASQFKHVERARRLQWQLQENLWHLDVMSHIALAWLKLTHRANTHDSQAQAGILRQAMQHLDHIRELNRRAMSETFDGERRGEYLDLNAFLDQFVSTWNLLDTAPKERLTSP